MALPNAGNDSQSYSRARRLGRQPAPSPAPPAPTAWTPLGQSEILFAAQNLFDFFLFVSDCQVYDVWKTPDDNAKSLILFMLPDETVKKLIVCFIVR